MKMMEKKQYVFHILLLFITETITLFVYKQVRFLYNSERIPKEWEVLRLEKESFFFVVFIADLFSVRFL